MCFFFPFYTTRDSRHQFQRKRPGGGKIYERQQLMTDDNIFTHLYSSNISFLYQTNLLLRENIRRGFHLPFNSAATLTETTRRNNNTTQQQHQNKLKKEKTCFLLFFFNCIVRKKKLLRETSGKKKNLSRKSLGYAVATPLCTFCSFDGVVATIYY